MKRLMDATPTERPRRRWLRWLAATTIVVSPFAALMWWWSSEPPAFDVAAATADYAREHDEKTVTGSATTVATIRLTRVLLDKRGGYLANDILPPGVLMDDLPNWEYGVVLQLRDLSLAMRNDFSRSQSQSVEDADLREAFNYYSYQHRRWFIPSTESQYNKAAERMEAYLKRLSDPKEPQAQFYARADNLAAYLALVEKRLGSLSQRLSASVGQERLNTDLAGDPSATQSTPGSDPAYVRTPWLKVDDVFYEARGTTYALNHILRAVAIDFAPVLKDKNALVSLEQIIRELDEAQAPVNSPIILNGGQFGFFANHSLVMANYVSRANAAMIDLRRLLERG